MNKNNRYSRYNSKLTTEARIADNRKSKERTGYSVNMFTSNAEMIGRLMLLISSKEAINVGADIDIEMVDILDHFRSSGLITSDEYRILHDDVIG